MSELPTSTLQVSGTSATAQAGGRPAGKQSSSKTNQVGFQSFGWLFGRRSRRRKPEGMKETRRQSTDEKRLARSPVSSALPSPGRLRTDGNSLNGNGQYTNGHSSLRNGQQGQRSPHSQRPNTDSAFKRRPDNNWFTKGVDPQILTNTPHSPQHTFLQQQTVLQQSTLLQGQEQRSGNRSSKRRRKQAPKAEPKQALINFTPRSRSMAIALYAARMLILSVGVGVLAGTILSVWNPANSPFAAGSLQTIKQATSAPSSQDTAASESKPSELKLSQEMIPLKTSLQPIIQQNPKFKPGVFLVDLDTNDYLDLSGSTNFSAASTIKVPILIAFFQDLDSGKIRLDEKLVMRKDLIGGGSGDLQYLPVGSQFTALDIATRMITISDNTATNMIIARLGGMSALNQRFKSWGMATTTLNTMLPDLQGTNLSTPKELVSLMVRVSQGDLVSLRSRDRLLDIMRRTVNNSQLPQGLGEGATIAHKTGDIGALIGDIGLVDMPSGKRYAIAVLVKREFNDDSAYELVQKISRMTYQYLSTAKASSSSHLFPAASKPRKP
jgi:beta-lactamase class A